MVADGRVEVVNHHVGDAALQRVLSEELRLVS